MSLGERLTPILVEIEEALWEQEAYSGAPKCFMEASFRAATKIFTATAYEMIFALIQKEDIAQEDAENMAFAFGNDLRKLIKTYTNINTHDWYDV